MWDFLKSLTGNVFGIIALIIFSPVIILALIIAGIVALVAVCVSEKNPAPATMVNMETSVKLDELKTTYKDKLHLDENNLSQLATLMEKLQKLSEEDKKLNKGELKELKKEIKHEVKDLKKVIKSQLTKKEYKAIKSELKHEFKGISKKSNVLLFKTAEDKKDEKISTEAKPSLSSKAG